MKTVMHVITGLNVGGAERALYTLLTNGLEGPCRNVVVSLMDEGHYGALMREKGIAVHCLRLKQGRFNLSALWQLRNIVTRESPDIVQGWMYHGNFVASIASFALFRKRRLCWNVRQSLDAKKDMSIGTKVMIGIGRLLSRLPNSIIYNSSASRIQHRTLGFSDAHDLVIPNGFDTQVWKFREYDRHKIRAEIQIDNDRKVVGYVGRNNTTKDLENLFSSISLVLKKNIDVMFVLVGKDIQHACPPSLRESSQITFLELRTDIPTVMSSFDFLLLSSKVEGFPNVVGEAMSSSIPCIATNVGDVGKIVGTTGWVVPPSDSEKLATAVILALSIPTVVRNSMGDLARKRIKSNYSIDAVCEKYVNLYTKSLT